MNNRSAPSSSDVSKPVLDHGLIQHLLSSDTEDHVPPVLDGSELADLESGIRGVSEPERAVAILAQQAMF
jgi:hypothetical protein